MGEINTLCDVALESFYACLEEFLLGIVDVREWVDGLLDTGGLLKVLATSVKCLEVNKTYAELDWNREEITSGLLGDGITSWYTWEVDERWLDDVLLSVETLEDGLGHTIRVSENEISKSSKAYR